MEKVKVSQLDRFSNIRENEVKKIGLRLGKKRLQYLAERQILTTSDVQNAPVSMLKEEEYFLKDYRPPFKKFDLEKSISRKDFDSNIGPKDRVTKSPLSRKVFINRLNTDEMTGPKWGSMSR
jgi:hypothetical protein